MAKTAGQAGKEAIDFSSGLPVVQCVLVKYFSGETVYESDISVLITSVFNYSGCGKYSIVQN